MVQAMCLACSKFIIVIDLETKNYLLGGRRNIPYYVYELELHRLEKQLKFIVHQSWLKLVGSVLLCDDIYCFFEIISVISNMYGLCRKKLFNMINELPSIFEVVTGACKKQPKEKTTVSNHSSSKSKSTPKVKKDFNVFLRRSILCYCYILYFKHIDFIQYQTPPVDGDDF